MLKAGVDCWNELDAPEVHAGPETLAIVVKRMFLAMLDAEEAEEAAKAVEALEPREPRGASHYFREELMEAARRAEACANDQIE